MSVIASSIKKAAVPCVAPPSRCPTPEEPETAPTADLQMSEAALCSEVIQFAPQSEVTAYVEQQPTQSTSVSSMREFSLMERV